MKKSLSSLKKTFVIIVLILIAKSSFGQQFTNLNEDYLGQTTPGDTAVIFAPGIISVENSREHCLALSPNGDEMFFASGRWPNSKIMHVKKLDNKWLPAEPAAFLINDGATQPAFSPDGRYLYFSSNRGKSDNRLYSIWRSEKIGNEWSEPEQVIKMSGDLIMLFHPLVDSNGSVYFLRWDFPNQTGDIYVCRASGSKLAEPVKLNSPISTEYNKVRPTVILTSTRFISISNNCRTSGRRNTQSCQ